MPGEADGVEESRSCEQLPHRQEHSGVEVIHTQAAAEGPRLQPQCATERIQSATALQPPGGSNLQAQGGSSTCGSRAAQRVHGRPCKAGARVMLQGQQHRIRLLSATSPGPTVQRRWPHWLGPHQGASSQQALTLSQCSATQHCVGRYWLQNAGCAWQAPLQGAVPGAHEASVHASGGCNAGQ